MFDSTVIEISLSVVFPSLSVTVYTTEYIPSFGFVSLNPPLLFIIKLSFIFPSSWSVTFNPIFGSINRFIDCPFFIITSLAVISGNLLVTVTSLFIVVVFPSLSVTS